AIPSPSMALALSNALLKTTPPRTILLLGRLESGGNVVSGFLRLEFGLYLILPALPDPYAANADFRDLVQRDAPRGMLTARVDWTAPEQPNLTLSLLPTSAELLAPALTGGEPQAAGEDSEREARLRAIFDLTVSATREQFLLLDVSSN